MERRKIPKAERMEVYNKYNGHCAYCGQKIDYKEMQVDHMIPLRLGGADNISNYMPACRTCNHYKRGNTLDGFREMIEAIPYKLRRDSYIYRVGLLYRMVVGYAKPIRFYFEQEDEWNI